MSSNELSPIGSSFESFLEEDGIFESVDEAAVKEVIAWQVQQGMIDKGLSKSALAKTMNTSRTQVDRLLDPSNTGVALHTLYRAATVLGKRLKIEFADVEQNEEHAASPLPFVEMA